MAALGAGLEAIFAPRSIAIIGASQDATKIGGVTVVMTVVDGRVVFEKK